MSKDIELEVGCYKIAKLHLVRRVIAQFFLVVSFLVCFTCFVFIDHQFDCFAKSHVCHFCVCVFEALHMAICKVLSLYLARIT